MQSRLVSFIEVLRSHQVRVSPAETLDAMAVATTLGYADRHQLEHGLSLALAKTVDEKAVFRQCFDKYFTQELADFSLTEQEDNQETKEASQDDGASDEAADSSDEAGSNDLSPLDEAIAADPELAALLDNPLMQDLRDNNRNELALRMARAGEQVGLGQIQMFTQRGQFTRKMLDALGEEHIRQAVIELERIGSPAMEELQRYRDVLREQVRDHVEREYLLHAEGRNDERMDEILAGTRLSHIEYHYQQKVQELVRKMAKKLAARYARKRKVYKRGQLDMPRTMRRGIPHDGIMFNTYWRRVNRAKPQVLAICDVSGSVAAYAKFLLMFLYSLADILPRVRSFAFSSHLGEVSELFEQHSIEKAVELVNWKYGGATDYAGSLQDFCDLALDDINSNTTVIILGDARNNNGDPRLDLLQQVFNRAKQVIWLNPESRKVWGSGDSEMLRYQSACHFTAECSNLKQLERFVDQLLRNTR